MKFIRKIALALALVVTPTVLAVPVVVTAGVAAVAVDVATADTAAADHNGSCWEVWDYVSSEWYWENGTFSVPTYYGWWQRDYYDVYKECEDHQFGEYLGRYVTDWYRCYC